jgi:hypothetical protein
MEANEPCLGRWVHDDASGLEGLVIEVKTGGWRVVLSVDGNSVNRRSGALEYAAGEPPAELVNTCQQDYGVPYAPATEAMRKKVLSRRRQEEIYKPRSKPPAPAPRPPAPRATLTSQKVRRGSPPPPRRRQAAASPFPRPALAQIKPPPGPGAPNIGDAVARLSEGGWRRGVVVARKPEDGPVEEGGHVVETAGRTEKRDYALVVRYEDAAEDAAEPWPANDGELFKVGGRLPEALTPPPKGLVGRGFRFDDGRTGFIVGFSSRESQFLVRIEGETARVPVHAARACLVRDQESTFGRVNRKAINEFNSNKPGIRRRTPSPEKRRRTPQRYDDDGDATMMPPPAPSETNQLATGPVSAAQEARDLAEALRRSREDAAPAPAPAEPSPTPFSGHALLQGLMQG